MKDENISRRIPRQDRLLREHIHDPYKLRLKLSEPTRCPQCGAVYRKGRWLWSDEPLSNAHEELCQACHRINDKYPAGELFLHGTFVGSHRDEVVALARRIEKAEKSEHALNRIIDIADRDGGMLITTTDIHLPHRIGHAVHDAWEGELTTHYDKEGYFIRLDWHRDA